MLDNYEKYSNIVKYQTDIELDRFCGSEFSRKDNYVLDHIWQNSFHSGTLVATDNYLRIIGKNNNDEKVKEVLKLMIDTHEIYSEPFEWDASLEFHT
jgi:hypothetical protein